MASYFSVNEEDRGRTRGKDKKSRKDAYCISYKQIIMIILMHT